MKNFPSLAEKKGIQRKSKGREKTRVNDRTISQVFVPSLSLANEVDTAMRRIVYGLPVPALEEPVADPLILEIEVRVCPSA